MNTGFTTQHSTEKPRVLLLGGNNQLSLIINHFLLSNDFLVDFLNLDDLDLTELENKIFTAKNLYKIIWVNLHLSEQQENDLLVSELLQKRSEPLINFTNYSQLKKTSKISANEKETFLVRENQKKIFVQDLVSPEEMYFPWNEIFFQFRKKTLLDPELIFFPCTTENIKKELKKLIFSPNLGQTILLRGTAVKSKELLLQVKDFFERNNEVNLQIKKASYLFLEQKKSLFDQIIELPTLGGELLSFLTRSASKAAININKNNKPKSESLKKTPALEVKIPEKIIPVLKPTIKPILKIEQKPEEIETLSQKEIEAELREIFQEDRVQTKTKKVVKKIDKTKRITKKQKRRKTLFFFSLFVFGLIAGILFLMVLFLLNIKIQSGFLHGEIKKLSENKSYQFVEEPFNNSLEKSSALLAVQYRAYSSFLPKSWLIKTDKNLKVFRYLKQYEKLKSENDAGVQAFLGFVFGNEKLPNSDFVQEIKNLRISSDELMNSLSFLQLELTGMATTKEEKTLFEEFVASQKKQLQTSSQLIGVLPDLLGEKSQKNYLLLLQNNMELTPGGGSIEAVALFSFESGKLKNYQVYDISSLENNIKGEWEAPEDFQSLFGKKNILAQESSWFLDFSDTSESFIKQSQAVFGKKIDGVLAINLISIEKILTEMGPIELLSYNEVISSDNLTEKIYLKASTDLNAKLGRDSYFTTLFKTLLDKTFSSGVDLKILKSLSDLAKEKQILVSVEGLSVFDDFSWSGKIAEPLCPTPFRSDCQIDSIFQTETNLGANYGNYAVSRSTKHSVVLGQKFAEHSRVVSYKNSSPSVSWPGGTYRAYLRFTTNKGSELEYFELDGKKIASDQIIVSSSGNKTTWGLVLELPPLSEKELLLKYKTPLKNQLSYGFFDQKQAGLGSDPLLLEISYSPTLSPTIIAPQAEVLENKLRFTLLRHGDLLNMVQFE